MRTLRLVWTLALALLLAGCLTPRPEPTPTGSPSDGSGSAESSSRVTRGSDGPASSTPQDSSEPLTDFEESLADTWRRFHVKNSGYSSEYSYYEYVSFNEDRTACKWKYGEESSSDTSDDVFDEGDYPDWRIAEQLSGSGVAFVVEVEGRGLNYVFDFTEDTLNPAGYDNLVFVRNTDGKSCVYRHGASF